MSWKITKDHIWKPGDTIPSRVGKHTRQWTDDLLKGPLYHFKLYDDDGELYYEGVNTGETFGPLDWAENDAGCTYIKYKQKGKGGRWEILNPKKNPSKYWHERRAVELERRAKRYGTEEWMPRWTENEFALGMSKGLKHNPVRKYKTKDSTLLNLALVGGFIGIIWYFGRK